MKQKIGGIDNLKETLLKLGYTHREQKNDYILPDTNGRYHAIPDGTGVVLHYDLQGPSGLHITNIPMPVHLRKETVRIQRVVTRAKADLALRMKNELGGVDLNKYLTENRPMNEIKLYDKEKMIQSAKLFLEAIGHPADDPNTLETPERIAKMNEILFAGYRKDVKDYIKTFPNPNPASNEPVILGGMEFYSTCAHHGKDFYGKATIAYLPGDQVLGLSKFGRIMRVYAGRLQLQEQMTQQIADALNDNIEGIRGVMVMVDAKHLCVSSRGVRIHDSFTRTAAVHGIFTQSEWQYQKVVDVHKTSSEGLFAY